MLTIMLKEIKVKKILFCMWFLKHNSFEFTDGAIFLDKNFFIFILINNYHYFLH
jgi:hypothetical protein